MTSTRLRLATWNVNSIRARHEPVLAWIDRHQPDVVALQETKCTDLQFDALAPDYQAAGYEVAHYGVDHYNGVAIISRVGLDDIEVGFPGVDTPPFDAPRLISALCAETRVYSVYVPNGRKYDDPHWHHKLDWLRLLRATIDVDEPAIAMGDFNVQPAPIDVYDPSKWKKRNHGSPPERAAIASLVDKGLRDVTREHLPEPGVYTWWNYRPGQFDKNKGMRIDLALCTDPLADRVSDVWIDREERANISTSDHAPLVIDCAGQG